jgi:hypothetical protein
MRDDSCVSTVPEIKEAIARLSPQEYCELMAELFPHADDEWDKQMKADAEAGRLDFIDREVEQAKREGTLIPLADYTDGSPRRVRPNGGHGWERQRR